MGKPGNSGTVEDVEGESPDIRQVICMYIFVKSVLYLLRLKFAV